MFNRTAKNRCFLQSARRDLIQFPQHISSTCRGQSVAALRLLVVPLVEVLISTPYALCPAIASTRGGDGGGGEGGRSSSKGMFGTHHPTIGFLVIVILIITRYFFSQRGFNFGPFHSRGVDIIALHLALCTLGLGCTPLRFRNSTKIQSNVANLLGRWHGNIDDFGRMSKIFTNNRFTFSAFMMFNKIQHNDR